MLYYYTFTELCFTGKKWFDICSSAERESVSWETKWVVSTPTVIEEYVAIYGKENTASLGFIFVSYIVMFASKFEVICT